MRGLLTTWRRFPVVLVATIALTLWAVLGLGGCRRAAGSAHEPGPVSAVPPPPTAPAAQAAAPAVRAARTVEAQPAFYDNWHLPARFRGRILRRRVRYFPTKLLALTFDDGPSAAITPRVLAALRRHHAHATFFVVGACARRYPQLVKEEAAEGNAVGSHSYDHPARTTPAQAQVELSRTAQIIRQLTGHSPVLFRPPYGITKGNLCRAALAQKYAAVLWSISSADSDRISAAVIAHNVIHTPNPGDFILMHDGAGHVQSAKALDQILTQLSAAGFKFVTLPHLMQAWDQWLAKHPAAAKSKAHHTHSHDKGR